MSFCGGLRACMPHMFKVRENLVKHKVSTNIENMELAGLETPTERLGLKSLYGKLKVQPLGPTLSEVYGAIPYEIMS